MPDVLEKGLPANLDAERFVLGSILLDSSAFVKVGAVLTGRDFSLESHRRIFARMVDLFERGERIDRMTVGEELMRHGQLEFCGGFSYLVSLDEGMPALSNFESYVRIVKSKAALRQVIFEGKRIIDRALQQEDEPAAIVGDAAESFLRLDCGAKEASGGLVGLREVIRGYEGGVNAFLDPSKRRPGLPTGFTKFDQMTGGLNPGDLFILAARPSQGKTAMAVNIAQHVSLKLAKTSAVFSLEMTREQLFTRLACSVARVDSQKFRAGWLNADERRRLAVAAGQINAAPIFIDDTPSPSLMQIHNRLRRLKGEKGLDLVVIDYLQLMSAGKAENRNQEISAMSRGCKILAKELGVPFLVLSQLNRDPEKRPGDHRPQLADLKESGGIEQDADLVAFIFREEVYKHDRPDLRGLAELLLRKQRNGPIGKILLTFIHEYTKFENRIADADEEPVGQGELYGE